MKVFDLHCDTAAMVYWGYSNGIREGGRHIDIGKLSAGGSFVQCFGMFAAKGKSDYKMDYLKDFIDSTKALLSKEPEMHLIRSMSEVQEARINALLTIEDSGCLQGDSDNLQYVYDQGIRMIGLLWNNENAYGYPNSEDAEIMSMGLKSAGIDAVEQMGRLGVVIDVSHLNFGGFWDVADICKGPFVASHSCAESLHHHRRNLTDEMIRTIAEHGGVIGINFCSEFATGNKEMLYLKDIAAQASYMKNIGGVDCLALGSDFDGVSNGFEFGDASGIQQVAQALLNSGFTVEEIEKVMYKNALRVFTDVCK